MAHIRIACLTGKTNKAGITSWYWQPSATLARAGWKPLALGKDEGKAIAAARARNQEVDLWKAGGGKPREVRQRVQQATLAALIVRYRREVIHGKKPSGAPRIAAKTRTIYETSLKRLETWAGKQPLAFITPARVRVLRDANARPVEAGGIGHSAAFNLLKVLRQLFAFAESIDAIPKGSNPAASFELAAPPPRRAVWEAEDEAAFIAAAYDLGLPSMALAIALALYTAQREGDLIAFTEPQYQEIALFDPLLRRPFQDENGLVMGWCLAQGKTSTEYAAVRLEIPLEPNIRARVEAAIRANRARDRAADPVRLLTHVLVNDSTGLPWKKRHFCTTWRKVLTHAADRAGRPAMAGLVWHDLRRTRVVRLRRRGMAKEMIAAITGHSPHSIDEMLKVYGPVDPTMTAAAIASSIAADAADSKARARRQEKHPRPFQRGP